MMCNSQLPIFCKLLFALLFSCLVQPDAVSANELPSSVKEMRVELDVINFDLKGDDRLAKLAKSNNGDAGYQMMAGFFNIQYASVKGGLGALKYAKAARKYLEASINIDPTIYGASAHSVLASMYFKVPGWPVSFGDKKKAIKNYQKALELSPNGIDSNFTYATYLYEKKKYAEAKVYLEKAKAAPPRPLRPRADQELHKTIDEALREIERKLNK